MSRNKTRLYLIIAIIFVLFSVIAFAAPFANSLSFSPARWIWTGMMCAANSTASR